MSTRLVKRSIDGGGHVFLYEEQPPPPCARGVCVEMLFDAAAPSGEIALSLRRTERHDGSPGEVDAVRASARVSIASGVCVPADAEAERLFAEQPWLREAFAPEIEWLRERVRRHEAQRDRSTSMAALDRAEPGAMIAYDELFPHDWNLLVYSGREAYWAVDFYCTNPACSCKEIRRPAASRLRLDAVPLRRQPSRRPRGQAAASEGGLGTSGGALRAALESARRRARQALRRGARRRRRSRGGATSERRGAGRRSGSQRAVPVRVGQEVQAVLCWAGARRGGVERPDVSSRS